jgi:hypothetical protein
MIRRVLKAEVTVDDCGEPFIFRFLKFHVVHHTEQAFLCMTLDGRKVGHQNVEPHATSD